MHFFVICVSKRNSMTIIDEQREGKGRERWTDHREKKTGFAGLTISSSTYIPAVPIVVVCPPPQSVTYPSWFEVVHSVMNGMSTQNRHTTTAPTTATSSIAVLFSRRGTLLFLFFFFLLSLLFTAFQTKPQWRHQSPHSRPGERRIASHPSTYYCTYL